MREPEDFHDEGPDGPGRWDDDEPVDLGDVWGAWEDPAGDDPEQVDAAVHDITGATPDCVPAGTQAPGAALSAAQRLSARLGSAHKDRAAGPLVDGGPSSVRPAAQGAGERGDEQAEVEVATPVRTPGGGRGRSPRVARKGAQPGSGRAARGSSAGPRVAGVVPRLGARVGEQVRAGAPARTDLKGPAGSAVTGSVLTSTGALGAAASFAGIAPAYSATAAVCGAGAAFFATAHGMRTARTIARREVIRGVAQALAPKIGATGAVTLQMTRWRSGWVGVPARIVLQYDGAADSSSPGFIPGILEAIARRLEREYEVVTHDKPRRRITMALLPLLGEREAVPELAVRTQKITKELFGPHSSATFGWDDEELVEITVAYQPTVRFTGAGVRSRTLRALETVLPGRWRAAWDLNNDRVTFEVRPTMPTMVEHAAAPITEANLLELPIGIDEDAQLVEWSLKSSDGTPHCLVIGPTGTGKTVVIRGVVMEWCRRGWSVDVCDPKRIEFVGMRGWPGVRTIASSVEDIVAVLEDTYREMERRYALIEAGTHTTDSFPKRLLVVDELRYLMGVIAAWYAKVKVKGDPSKCPALDHLDLILVLSRSAGIHVLTGIQRPDAYILGGDSRDQFGCRVSMGRCSPQAAQMVWENVYTGTSVPRGQAGRGTGVLANGEPGEVQTYWTPDLATVDLSTDSGRHDAQILEALRAPENPTVRCVVVPPQPQVDLDSEEASATLPLLYEDFAFARIEPLERHPELRDRPDLRLVEVGSLSKSANRRVDLVQAGLLDSVQEPVVDEDFDVAEPVDYLEPVEIVVRKVVPGQLMDLDDGSGAWAVVEQVDVEDDQVFVFTRDDETGQAAAVLQLDDSTRVTVRNPADQGPEDFDRQV